MFDVFLAHFQLKCINKLLKAVQSLSSRGQRLIFTETLVFVFSRPQKCVFLTKYLLKTASSGRQRCCKCFYFFIICSLCWDPFATPPDFKCFIQNRQKAFSLPSSMSKLMFLFPFEQTCSTSCIGLRSIDSI